METFHRPLVVRDRDIAAPGPGEVTTEVKACGLCMTDIDISEGRVPSVQIDPDIGEPVPIREISEALESLRQGRYVARSVPMLPFD